MKYLMYVYGDVREPIKIEGVTSNYIIHCCNAIGGFGSGVAHALLTKWPEVREHYLSHYKLNKDNNFLGSIDPVFVDKGLAVVNMIGQQGIGPEPDGKPPIRYDALREAINRVCEFAKGFGDGFAIHVPYYMGCDRAMGEWEVVHQILLDELVAKDVPVIVYDILNKLGLKREDKKKETFYIGEEISYDGITWMVEAHNGHMCLHNNGKRIFVDDSIASQSEKVKVESAIGGQNE